MAGGIYDAFLVRFCPHTCLASSSSSPSSRNPGYEAHILSPFLAFHARGLFVVDLMIVPACGQMADGTGAFFASVPFGLLTHYYAVGVVSLSTDHRNDFFAHQRAITHSEENRCSANHNSTVFHRPTSVRVTEKQTLHWSLIKVS